MTTTDETTERTTKPMPMALRVPLVLAFEMRRQIRTAMGTLDPDGDDEAGDLHVLLPGGCFTGSAMPWREAEARWLVDDWTALVALEAWAKHQDGGMCDGTWESDPEQMADIIATMIMRGVTAALVMQDVTPNLLALETLARNVATMCVHARPG